MLTSLIFHPSSVFGQGSLTPPGAPWPTMKTLEQVEPRRPIDGGVFGTGVGIFQPGSYYLTGNIIVTNDPASGVVVFANNVTLDLNGFSIISTRALPTNTRGVETGDGFTNLTVRNGRIVGFQTGLLSFSNHTIVENLTIADSRMRGINIIGNNTTGFVTVIRNTVILNTDLNQSGLPNSPAQGILTQSGANGVIEGNVISGVFGLAPPSGLVGEGILVDGATHMLVINNRIANANTGLRFNGAGRYRDNVTMSVTTPYSGGTNLGNNQ